MLKKSIIVFAVFICFFAGPASAAPQRAPSKEATLDLAAKYVKKYESKLDFKIKEDLKAIRAAIKLHKAVKVDFQKTINDLVNVVTLKLAAKKDIKAIAVASAVLVQSAPDSPRTANLFAAVLHAMGQYDEAVLVFQYILIGTPDSELVKLNLANVYEDMGRWEEAKSLAESVISKNGECRAAHKVLAHYYFSKKNTGMFARELLKASLFKGYVKGKLDSKNHGNKIQKETEKEDNDSLDVLEKKVGKVREADVSPYTTADIIEEEFPKEAGQIRDKYTVLSNDEQFILPRLPGVKVNDLLSYRKNVPMLEAWSGVFRERLEKVALNEAASMGIDASASDEVKKAQAEAAAKKKSAEAMQNAQDALKYLQDFDVPGMTEADKAKAKDAMKKLQSASKEQGVELKDNPVDASSVPGIDNGSRIVLKNYNDYGKISALYEAYLFRYYNEKYIPEVKDIVGVYQKKCEQENAYYGQRMDEIEKRNGDDIAKKQEELRHKKKINEIGLESYLRWVNLYMPEYARKMKPTLDAYYRTCMLYIKNMNDRKVMEREFWRVKKLHMFYALEAGSHIMDGGGFEYLGPTDKDEEELRQAMKDAEEAAKAEKRKYEDEFKEPGFDISKWIEDHLVLEVSCEFLTLKINSTSIEFEAWAFGPDGGIKYDWNADTLETYSGYGPKFDFGVNIAGAEIGVEAKFDIVRKTAKWDFTNGTYEESYGTKGEVKVKATDKLSAGVEMSLNSQLEAKISGKIAVEGAGYIEGEQEL